MEVREVEHVHVLPRAWLTSASTPLKRGATSLPLDDEQIFSQKHGGKKTCCLTTFPPQRSTARVSSLLLLLLPILSLYICIATKNRVIQLVVTHSPSVLIHKLTVIL